MHCIQPIFPTSLDLLANLLRVSDACSGYSGFVVTCGVVSAVRLGRVIASPVLCVPNVMEPQCTDGSHSVLSGHMHFVTCIMGHP